METHARTIIKAVTWRSLGTLMTVLVAWSVTHKASVAASIGVMDTLLKIGGFYVHERLWLRVDFGRQPTPTVEAEEAA